MVAAGCLSLKRAAAAAKGMFVEGWGYEVVAAFVAVAIQAEKQLVA